MEEKKLNLMPQIKSSPIRVVKNEDLSKWAEFRATSLLPERRSYMCSCIYKNRLYIFGGVDIQEGSRDSLYSIDIGAENPEWLKHKYEGVASFKYSHAASVLINNKWYMIGGNVNNDQSADIFIVNLDEFKIERLISKNLKGTIPVPFDSHSAVLTSDNNKIIVFGGYSGAKKTNKIYEFDISTATWKELAAQAKIKPAPRANHCAAMIGSNMFIFGGSGEESDNKADLWKFNIATAEWTEIVKKEGAEWPQARAGHSAVVQDDKILIFGGNLELALEINDIYEFDTKTTEWKLLSAGGRPADVEDKLKALAEKRDSPKKKPSGDYSPRTKLGRSMAQTKEGSPHASSPKSPFKKSPDASPIKVVTKAAQHPDYEKLREDMHTPIVVAMTNSVVMKATSSIKKKGGEDISEVTEKGRVIGNYPCGRDGYAMQIFFGKVFIFGGDRFQMAYNDLYSYSL